MHPISKLGRLLVIRQLALHPDGITVRRVRYRTVDGTVTPALEPEISLPRPRCVPVEEHLRPQEALGERLGLGDGLALVLLEEPRREALLVGTRALADGVRDGFVEALEARLRQPLVLDRLQLLASLLTHDVRLCPDSNQAVDVLTDGHEHLAGHVSALLGPGRLVLDVDAGSTLLDEQLGQLHDGRQATVASVTIGDDGAEVVDVGQARPLGLRCRQTLVPLLPVVEELRHEEVGYLVGDGGLKHQAV
ncbi:hypothetical protein VP1G_11414 [Cytospora mali]|uniref:Uncharacterized protein n=1 Tax=Cytospora mali TaxID=578113 RepID=A0A194VF71_CYTMA|nr:hypothetical protein VP1G_11414 [Valsa mali var. pyri (nom. inval.)]